MGDRVSRLTTIDGKEYDEYFHYVQMARNGYGVTWVPLHRFVGVTLASVSCNECKYVTSYTTENPKSSYRQHVRRNHRDKYFRELAKTYVIKEEPELHEESTHV